MMFEFEHFGAGPWPWQWRAPACVGRHTSGIHKLSHPCAAVVASEKGVVVGRLTFQEDGDVIDCARMGVGGKAIPPNVDKVSVFHSRAACILTPVLRLCAYVLDLQKARLQGYTPAGQACQCTPAEVMGVSLEQR